MILWHALEAIRAMLPGGQHSSRFLSQKAKIRPATHAIFTSMRHALLRQSLLRGYTIMKQRCRLKCRREFAARVKFGEAIRWLVAKCCVLDSRRYDSERRESVEHSKSDVRFSLTQYIIFSIRISMFKQQTRLSVQLGLIISFVVHIFCI